MYIKRILFLVFTLNLFISNAQTILLDEDFNDCNLPENWNVDIEGNEDLVWYIDDFNHNKNSDSSSIDGSCMVVVDDDATGNDTPGFKIRFNSPNFDGTIHRQLFLEADIHFRVHDGNFFRIYINDGFEDHLLVEYNNEKGTGTQFSEFDHLELDISGYASDQNTIIIEYEDTGDFGWYGAFDNIYVWSEGEGENLIIQNFDECSLPTDWTTNIVTGEDDWQFGIPNNGITMNGSCFAFFDDDAIGKDQPFSIVELKSPVFDGTAFKRLFADFDVILRSVNEREGINIIVESNGERHNLISWYDGHGGPQFNEIEHESIDLSAYKSNQMHIIFQYDDGKLYGWWTGIDNVVIYGHGTPTDICTKAIPIELDQICTPDKNTYSATDEVVNSCYPDNIASIWYKYDALVDGKVHANTNASFNDLITIFEGDCENLIEISCSNRDEYGFTGENAYFETEAGQVYYIRIAGIQDNFGNARGDLCLQLNSINSFPTESNNDLCINAIPVIINEDCTISNNRNNTMTGVIPMQNIKARADNWFQFKTGNTANYYHLKASSDFSSSIILYEGVNCNNLVEIASNEKGMELYTPLLSIDKEYYIQITAFFATTEGELCLSIKETDIETPNDNCIEATSINIGENCLVHSNINSQFSGIKPACVQDAKSDMWFSFTAPSSSAIKFLPDMSFISTIAIYQGQCDTLEELHCIFNPQKCDGYIQLDQLTPDQTYYIQVISTDDYFNIQNNGTVCIQLLDGISEEEYIPVHIAATLDCTEYGIGELTYFVTDGQAPYSVEGIHNGGTVHTDETYIVVVTDNWGCQTSIIGEADCGGEACYLAGDVRSDTITCITDTINVWANIQNGLPPYRYLWSTGDTTDQINLGIDQLDVSVEITDAQNCVITSSPVIIQNVTAPTITLDELSHGHGDFLGSIAISIEGAHIQIQWYYEDAIISENDFIVDLEAGDYTVVVTNTMTGCSSEATYTVDYTINTESVEHQNSVKVISNLTQTSFIVQYNFDTPKDVHLSLYNIKGQKVLSTYHNNKLNQNEKISIDHLVSGYYKLVIYSGETYWYEQIIIYE